MNSPEETQLADDLRHLAQGPSFATDLDAIEHRGRRAQQRALALRGLAATGVVGVAVAGTLVAFRHPASNGTAPIAAPTAATTTAPANKTTTAAPRIQNLAYVRQQVEAAPYPADSVVAAKQTQSGSGGYTTAIWTDPVTGNTYEPDGDGAKTGDWEHDYFDSNKVLHWDQTEVNYGQHTWWNFNEHASGPISGPVPKGPISGDYTSAAWVKKVLAHGYGKIIGHPVVDGRPTVEVSASYLGMKWLFYVDSKTYLVVRQVKYFPAPLDSTLTDDYTWVKRTTALTERINHPQIPAGYTQVAPPN